LNPSRTLCVMGTFDGRANREVCRIKDKLQSQGIMPDTYEPHITFGIYTELDEARLVNWIGSVSAERRRIQTTFNHFGFFPDARFCFLAASASYNLLDLHAHIHQKYDEFCEKKGCLYSVKQNNWTPHMTIASVEQGQEGLLLSILWEDFFPFTAELTRLKITSSDMSQDLGVFELQTG
jgi:2'-5' RNA ligase